MDRISYECAKKVNDVLVYLVWSVCGNELKVWRYPTSSNGGHASEPYIDNTVEIFAEIVNPSNLTALKNLGILSVIVSNRIISLAMIQLLTHPGSKRFYRDMISTNNEEDEDGIDFELVKACELFDFDDHLVFTSKAEMVQVMYNSTNKTMMCIGVIYKGASKISFLCDKMDVEEESIINRDDELIIVKY
jgi:hypothetical protein